MKISKKFLKMESEIKLLQKNIREGIERVDGKKFKTINWKHKNEGGGKTLILSQGNVFEKAGLNISSLKSTLPEEMAKLLNTKAKEFKVCGLSLVFHPISPKIPTIHMNIRYFEMKQDSWFGGGVDLTPYYPYKEDFNLFHQEVYQAVKKVYPTRYQEFKKNCDEYFYLKHRKEMRGISGVFFDYLKNKGKEIENHKSNFELVSELGKSFIPSYLPIVEKRKKESYNQEEKDFQQYRRGRYVEFNLLYDRGTHFGLKTGGRIESILMSLPPTVTFPTENELKFTKNSFQSKMSDYYQTKNWI